MTTNLPLIRLSAINPFLLELRLRGVDARPTLRDLGLPGAVPAPQDLFAAAETIYEFVELTADLAADPHLGFTIGSNLELQNWDPIARAADEAGTVGELLTMFAVYATKHSSATLFLVKTEGEQSTFGFRRTTKPKVTPAQNDAFYMGLMRRILKRATREHWDPARVLFTVSDPSCVPTINDACRIAKGDKSGVRIRFPSLWLFERLGRSPFAARTKKEPAQEVPRSLVDSLRTALRPHLQDSGLTADKAAKLCGHDRRRLARQLREMGTTLSREIAMLRAEEATRELIDTNHSVADIGVTVGFTDPTVFSRAFKNWTGQSPREYRRSHKATH